MINDVLKSKEDLLKPFKIGEVVEGKIIGIERAAIFLDLGIQGTGIIYGKEFFEAKEILKNQKIGDKLHAKVVASDNEEGFIELSLAQAKKEITWQNLSQQQKEGEIIKAKILKANKGGLMTEIGNIPAFLPVSQLAPEHYPRIKGGESSQVLRELQKFVGQELEVKILTLNQRNNQLILSEKAKEAEKIKEILKNHKVGDIVEGEIIGVVDFGVFIKFFPSDSRRPKPTTVGEGQSPSIKETSLIKNKPVEAKIFTGDSLALEGLIHISELDWKIIEDPLEIVKIGQKVKAKIIEIAGDKVSLSLKALKKDPWEGTGEKYKKGSVVPGKVTKFNPFGAFIQITPKIQGLCHISEFGSQKKMTDCLKINEKYNFKILLIEPKDHRMTLRLEKE
ncbi:MAG: 30S ribosomal protein S1 [Candidatus Nealsonbacteria bacterium RBG_13_36_15]|uniref:30S ribosomal protein S1 n=1 Tax=Candidatus Nealsonbacteria bacterium RBG_13_36_15 TaxID=1801660 RepID=A0A1G2DWS9_9BACT|nr:MAG: 30S ribosomal protein S1 [Candidatus Nealsonbacteria bacterium RBG_13_36_15]